MAVQDEEEIVTFGRV